MIASFFILARTRIEVGRGFANCHRARGKPKHLTASPRAPLNYFRHRVCFNEAQLPSSEKLRLFSSANTACFKKPNSHKSKSRELCVFSQYHTEPHHCLTFTRGSLLLRGDFPNPTVSQCVALPHAYTDCWKRKQGEEREVYRKEKKTANLLQARKNGFSNDTSFSNYLHFSWKVFRTLQSPPDVALLLFSEGEAKAPWLSQRQGMKHHHRSQWSLMKSEQARPAQCARFLAGLRQLSVLFRTGLKLSANSITKPTVNYGVPSNCGVYSFISFSLFLFLQRFAALHPEATTSNIRSQ